MKTMKTMKLFKTLCVVFASALALTSCDAVQKTVYNKVAAQGTPYELIVVCDQAEWGSELGDSLRSVLSAYVPYLNQDEPRFDLLRIPVRGYKDLLTQHRNILEVNINPTISKASVAVRYDINAAPQIIMTLQAPTIEAATEYVATNGESIVKGFEMAERDRAVDFAKKYSLEKIDLAIEDKFGVSMKIPQGYTIRQNTNPDMMWISHEYPVASQGVVIYSYPAEFGVKSLSEPLLVDARNKYVALIPGPTDGSYMTTFTEVPQIYRTVRINGRLWVEMRGWWDVVNDYMGGPYVSYSTIDEATNKVFTVDSYIYSPKDPKRNYLRGVESLVYNVEFPAAKAE